MPHKQEVQFHIQEAIHHVRQAGGITLQLAPEEPQKACRLKELAGNELLVIADHLENVKAFASKPIVMG